MPKKYRKASTLSRTVGEKPCERPGKKAEFAPMNKKSKKNAVTLSVYPLLFMQLKKWALQKKSKKFIFVLDGGDTPCYHVLIKRKSPAGTKGEKMAPSQREVGKKDLHIYLPIELYIKFKKKAARLKVSMVELITLSIIQETKEIKLTEQDYEEIFNFKNRRRH